MTSDQCHPGEPVFASLAMIGRIETEGERNGKIEQETRHYRSIALRALTFAGVAGALGRGEPSARGVGRNLPRRPRVLQDRPWAAKHGDHPSRAGWNVDYLETLIRQTA
jgi:hypothetical protein